MGPEATMATFTLSSYSVTLRRRDNDELVSLGSLPGEDTVRSALLDFLGTYTGTFSHDKDKQRLFRVDPVNKSPPDLSGRVETGDYGYETTLVDSTTGRRSHTRSREEAELLPFYFLARLPDSRLTGGLLLQRFKQFGMKTAVWNTFRSEFNSRYPGFKLELNTIVPNQLFQHYIDEGQVMKVRFLRDDVPSDVADSVGEENLEERGYVEYILHAKRNERFAAIKDKLRRWSPTSGEASEFVEVSGFDYDNVKVELNVHGSRRTIDLSDTGKIRPYLDITEDVELGEDGHPTPDSLETIANDWIEDIWAQFSVDS